MIPAVIPYYKKMLRLRRCKKCLKAQTLPVNVHVVDDNRKHSGYTAAVNRGLRYWLNRSDWDYIMVLDQDMYLDSDAVEHLQKCMEQHPQCGIAVALQKKKDRPMFVQGCGRDCYPLGLLEEAHISYYEDRDMPVFWADTACMMIRRECMQDIGVLDENMKFICSDSDYCFTARSKGWEVWIPGKAMGIHEKGQAHPDTWEHLSSEAMREVPIIQQMRRDMEFFEKKWVTSGYYEILKFEENKPIFIIRDGVVVPSDGQSLKVEEMKQDWLKQKQEREDKMKGLASVVSSE